MKEFIFGIRTAFACITAIGVLLLLYPFMIPQFFYYLFALLFGKNLFKKHYPINWSVALQVFEFLKPEKNHFEDYIENVKEQLECNATDYYKDNFITYYFSNEQIYDNLDYFEKCMKSELSAYKALLFFSDYLRGERFD